MDAQMKIDRCTTRLLRLYPFWGSLILGFEVSQSESMTKTMATDGVVLIYNPKYVEQQEEEILCTDLAHEAGHKMFLDSFRQGHRDAKLWNIACDFRINLYLKDSGFRLGDDYLIDERFRGMDAEEIYDHLQNNPEDPAWDQVEDKGGHGCGSLENSHSEPSEGQGQEDQNGSPSDGDGKGDQPGKPSITMAEVDFGESEVLMQIAQAKNFAKAQGKLPGSINEVVEEILNPKVRWEQIVERFMECCSQDDFSWQTPDRRMLYLNVYLPGLESEGVDEFVVCLDTSGSTLPFIPQFLSEVSKIASVLKFKKLYVMYVDTIVQHVDEYDKADMPINPRRTYGGGGTSFVPTFDWLEERGIVPKGMIYLTDTHGEFPTVPPPFPVLWTVPTQCKGSIEFGEMVEIE